MIADAPTVDAPIADALKAYATRLGLDTSPAQREHLALLSAGRPAVVAGQQAGLLTGPAYAVHKGVDAVLRARELGAAPVYWIASQDHDAAEVRWATLCDRAGAVHRLELPLPGGPPVGRQRWQAPWTGELARQIGAMDYPAEHRAAALGLLARSAHGGWAEVFARTMHALLGETGLLLLDPLAPEFAGLFVPGLLQEIEDPQSGPEAIEAAARALEAAGEVPALRRTPGSSNLFLEEDDGVRRLLRLDGAAFVASRRYSRADLRAILLADPSRLTPAAGLRPALQVRALPTAALVLGPGEQAYFRQLAGVFAQHGVNMPPLLDRLSVTWLEPPAARLLGRLGLSAAELRGDPERVLAARLAARRGDLAALEAALLRAEAELRATSAALTGVDPGLSRSARRLEAGFAARAAKLRRQAERALLQRDDHDARQARRALASLFPFGRAQERELSFFSLLLGHGRAPLRQLLALPAGAQVELRVEGGP